jgi:hypothetical protein
MLLRSTTLRFIYMSDPGTAVPRAQRQAHPAARIHWSSHCEADQQMNNRACAVPAAAAAAGVVAGELAATARSVPARAGRRCIRQQECPRSIPCSTRQQRR